MNNDQGRNGKRFNKKNKKNKKHNKNKRLREVAHKQPTQRKDKPLPEVLEYTDGMNAQDLGKILHRSPAEIVKKLFMLGVMINQNQSLDKDTIELLATDYGIEAKEKVEQQHSHSKADCDSGDGARLEIYNLGKALFQIALLRGKACGHHAR